MQITKKGFYRTRGGDVAFVGYIPKGNWKVGGTTIDKNIDCWNSKGRFYPFNETKNDLVEFIKEYSEDMLK